MLSDTRCVLINRIVTCASWDQLGLGIHEAAIGLRGSSAWRVLHIHISPSWLQCPKGAQTYPGGSRTFDLSKAWAHFWHGQGIRPGLSVELREGCALQSTRTHSNLRSTWFKMVPIRKWQNHQNSSVPY